MVAKYLEDMYTTSHFAHENYYMLMKVEFFMNVNEISIKKY